MQNYLTISTGKDEEGQARSQAYRSTAALQDKSFSKLAREVLDKAFGFKFKQEKSK